MGSALFVSLWWPACTSFGLNRRLSRFWEDTGRAGPDPGLAAFRRDAIKLPRETMAGTGDQGPGIGCSPTSASGCSVTSR